jgi:hypothetical protein
VLAVAWVALGFWAVKDDEMWRGAAAVALGALWGSMYWWPDSVVTRLMEKPMFKRRKHSDEVSAPDRG